MKSVKEQILFFLQNNSGIFHGGDLQRMLFETRNKGNATGDSIKRRLNELVDEGKAFVSYNGKHEALFSANPAHIKTKPHYKIEEINGIPVAVLTS